MRSESKVHSQINKVDVGPIINHSRVPKESVFGDFTCVLRGYSSILTLREMQDKAAHTHQVDVGRERKIACGLIFCSIIFICILCIGYYFLIFNLHYDLQDGLIIIMEIFCVLSFLIVGMCMFRYCSLRDISPLIIWKRVAQTQCSPLKLIKFDMEHVNVTYFEYIISYGEYPHKLHEPIITLIKKHKICNARDLVKITKKDPDKDNKELIQNNESYSKYGAVYFHYKGDDDYLLERWKYEFGKYNTPLLHVYRQCSKFNHVFHTHFDNRFRIPHNDHNVKSKYIHYRTSTKDKEDNIISILDGFDANMIDKTDISDDDDYYHNTHESSYTNSGHMLHSIHPKLFKKSHTTNNHTRHKIYNSVKPHTPSDDYIL